MKLEFTKTTTACLRPVLRETRCVEESVEAIVPDSCPDGLEVLHTSGLAFLRGKEMGDGVLSLSAGVCARALVAVEGRDRPEVVEVYLPVALKVENSLLSPDLCCRAEVELRRLDGLLVNSRKVMVRATVAFSLWVYQQEQQDHLDKVLNPDVEVLEQQVALRCLTTMGEKSYTLEDQMELGTQTGEIAGCWVRFSHGEQRLTGTRTLFRGTATVELFYFDPDGRGKTATGELPFSQYIDLGDCQETDELVLSTQMSGAEFRCSGNGTVTVTLQLSTTAQVWGLREIPWIEDIYSLNAQVRPEFVQRSYESLVDRQLVMPTAYGTPEDVAGEALFSFPVAGEMHCHREGEEVTLTQPVTLHSLYQTGEGRFQGKTCHTQLEFRLKAAENCRMEALEKALLLTPTSGAVKVEARISLGTLGTTDLRELQAGELSEEEPCQPGPGLIIRRIGKGESLWKLAKEYRTTRASIVSANGLEQENLEGKMLLIPKCR